MTGLLFLAGIPEAPEAATPATPAAATAAPAAAPAAAAPASQALVAASGSMPRIVIGFSSGLTGAAGSFSCMEMARMGHTFSHFPQETQSLWLILGM